MVTQSFFKLLLIYIYIFFKENQSPNIQSTAVPVKEEKGKAYKQYVVLVDSNIYKVLSKSPPWNPIFLENEWIQTAKEQDVLPAM